MNKILLSATLTALLASCSPGSSGSSGSSLNPALPSVPDAPSLPANSQFQNLTLNYLYSSSTCVDNGDGSSSKLFVTRLSSDTLAYENDRFAGNTTCSANLFSTQKYTLKVISFVKLTFDQSFDLLSMSLISNEIVFYNSSDATMFTNSGLYGFTWIAGQPHDVACRKIDGNNLGAQAPCAGTAGTEKIRFNSGILNYGNLVYQ